MLVIITLIGLAILTVLYFDFVGEAFKHTFKILNRFSALIVGYLLYAAILGAVVIPFVFFDVSWFVLKVLCLLVTAGIFIAAWYFKYYTKFKYWISWKSQKIVIAIIAFVFFVFLSGITTNIYTVWGDGAYWLAMYNDTIGAQNINMIDPNTGIMAPFFDPHYLSGNYVLVSTIADLLNVSPTIIATSIISFINISFTIFAVFDVVRLVCQNCRKGIQLFLTLSISGAFFFVSVYFALALVPWMGNGFTRALLVTAIPVLFTIIYDNYSFIKKIILMLFFTFSCYFFASTVFFIIGAYFGIAIIYDILISRKIRWNRIVPLLIGMLILSILMFLVILKQNMIGSIDILDLTTSPASTTNEFNIKEIILSYLRYFKTFFFVRYPIAIIAGILWLANWRKFINNKPILFLGGMMVIHWILEAPLFQDIISKFITTPLLYHRFPDANFVFEISFLFLLVYSVLKEFHVSQVLQCATIILVAFTLVYPGIEGQYFLLTPGTFKDSQALTYNPFNFQIYDEDALEIAQVLQKDSSRHLVALPNNNLRAAIRTHDRYGELLMNRIYQEENWEESVPVVWDFSDEYTKKKDARQLNLCLDNNFYSSECDELAPIIINRQGVDYVIAEKASNLNSTLNTLYENIFENNTYILYKIN